MSSVRCPMFRKPALNTLLLLLVGATGAACADFEAGLKAYEKGDYTNALAEWEPLAKSGNSAAQFNLGLLLYEGKGVPQSYSEAVQWFERAANQGYTRAQRNLGAMYAVGKGVKRDYVQAYEWLSLCAASGEQSCADQRDLVAKKLSANKLASAQRMAREWKPKKEPEP